MTDYASLLFDSVARLRKAATTEAVCREMVEFAARLGFDRVIVCSLFPRPGEDELIDELFFVHGDWAEGRSAQERDAYLLHCPVTRHILELDEPFFWSKSPSEDPERMTYRIVR
ncbi:TPA: autoinducer binding domain-containing protein, partial [Pseudomonas aeruginosa]